MARTFRRLLALAIVAALTSINVQAADLHVHATAGQVDQDHHHGPASHHHDEAEHHSSDTTQVVLADETDVVVHVSLVAPSAKPAKPVNAEYTAAPLFEPAAPVIIDGARIVARAHGPPSLARPSLRAPPALLPL